MEARSTGPLPPGSVIGILGGGQLGRLTALAAARFGYRCHIFTPETDSPASQVSAASTVADWTDEAALLRFAAACDVVTYEFENIPADAAARVASQTVLRPNSEVLATCQNRIVEKTFLADIGAPLARWRPAGSVADLERAIAEVGTPAVLKSARLGYDGKGQAAIASSSDLVAAWTKLIESNGTDEPLGVVEAWVDFTLEISVIVARSTSGDIVTWVPVENRHENHILRKTVAPAPIDAAVAAHAEAIACRVAGELALEGIMAVEMFVTREGHVLVNELAPRPHNSGHWTIDACAISQFEQCVRAVAGLPLGPTERHADAVMENLLGFEVERWPELVADPEARVHLYGKNEARPGRKMGHVTRLLPRTFTVTRPIR
jgi:5-(carboxyamino)imidazole ribonucleotide synthase